MAGIGEGVMRARHLCSGILAGGGVIFAVASIITASQGLRGYGDVFSFLGTLILSGVLVRAGFEAAA